jgi:hypothetical protein
MLFQLSSLSFWLESSVWDRLVAKICRRGPEKSVHVFNPNCTRKVKVDLANFAVWITQKLMLFQLSSLSHLWESSVWDRLVPKYVEEVQRNLYDMLINPNCTSKVKVDLANFDIKFWTKFVCIRFIQKNLFLQECLPYVLDLLTGCQKITFWPPF